MVRSLADECCPSPNGIVAEGMSGSRTRTGRRVQGDMGEGTTQGDNATESMNQARLPRQVHDPNTERDRPVRVFSLGHYGGSARVSVWKWRVLVLFVPQRGQTNHAPNSFFH